MKSETGETWVGRSIPRQEDERLVTGTGQFADDFDAPGVLHCAILRSPHAHATIASIDVSKARAMPGVVVAISGVEAAEHWSPHPAPIQHGGAYAPLAYSLATDTVVYQGEGVAAVAATDRYLAEDALAAIDVTYDVLETVGIPDPSDVNWSDQVHPVSPRVYEGLADNVQQRFDMSVGDVDTAFAEADVVVAAEIRVHRYEAMPLEARAVLADFDPIERKLTVRLSTQAPHMVRSVYSEIFGLPETSIRVLTGDVGGGFGSKYTADGDVIPILLSVLAGRPVKWAETREEWLLSGPVGTRGYVHLGELAVRSDGTVLGLRDRLLVDLGCDGVVRQVGGGAAVVGCVYGPGPYRIGAYDVKLRGMVSNAAPYGGYRGYGKDISNQLTERLMDKAAQRLGLDPVEMRRRNLVAEFPHELCSGPLIESGSFIECLDLVSSAMRLPELREEAERSRTAGVLVGLGIVSCLEPSGAGIPGTRVSGVESATVRVYPDGSVALLTGIQPIGQGIETSYAQVVADCLGVSPSDVQVKWGDTDAVPYGQGAYASRGVTFGVGAALKAATEVRRRLDVAAAIALGCGTDDVIIRDGVARVREDGERRVTMAELARKVYFEPGPYLMLPGVADPSLEATSTYTSPEIRWMPDEQGRVRLYPTHASGAIGCRVVVDGETGQVEISKIWVAHDCGRIVNPSIVDNQIAGSAIQALGGTMFEQILYDDQGNLLTRTLTDYQLANFGSVPDIEIMHLETLAPNSPLGAKGAGEGCHIGLGAALLAAVEDALRPLGVVDVLETPLTPDRVLALIRAAQVPQPASVPT